MDRRMPEWTEHPLGKVLGFAVIWLAFGATYGQLPLYSSNQNGYFVSGLARAGLGSLSRDWFAGTTDPVPAFSRLVTWTYALSSPAVFYLYQFILQGLYILSLVAIAAGVFGAPKDARRLFYVVLAACLIVLHSAAFGAGTARLMGVDLSRLATSGLAGLYVLGPIFQPSAFGVFLLVSVLAFLHGKAFWAVVLLAVAGSFHPSSLWSAALLTASYMGVIAFSERNPRKAALVGGLALLLVLPTVGYVYVAFKPTSPEVLARAYAILVDTRSPHHLRPASWFSASSVLQVALVLGGVAVVRRTKLFPILLFSFLGAAAPTIIQLVTSSKALAVLLPWRTFVLLVPISSAVLVAWLMRVGWPRLSALIVQYERPFLGVLLAVTVPMVVFGAWSIHREFGKAASADEVPMMDYVASHKGDTDLYLVPADLQRFRLYTGAPILVDWKANPYKDVELLEWYHRIELTRQVYTTSQHISCIALREVSFQYGVTHLVAARDTTVITNCGFLREVYADPYFVVYWVDARGGSSSVVDGPRR
jgi:hypothetical protein